MRIIRRPAVQGHAVPATAHHPRGPFPSELFRVEPIEGVEPERPDPLATAQNNYVSPVWVRCRLCGEIMTSEDSDSHGCA